MKNRHSIIYRVTFYYAAALILMLVLVFSLLYVLGSQTLRTSSQAVVERVVRDAFDHIEFNENSIEVGGSLDLFTEGVSLLIYDGDGQLILGTLPNNFPSMTPLVSGRHHKIDAGDETSTTWNVYDMMVNYRSASIWVRGISNSGTATTLMSRLLTGATIILPLLAALAVVLGYLITKRAFSPIQVINRTVNEIQGSQDLERRIKLDSDRQDEIHELGANFNDLFARLQERFRKEQQFTSDASHELRTPIAAIQARAERGIDEDATDEERLHALNRILWQTKAMSNIINQLLLLTRADRQKAKLEIEPIDLGELCELVVEAHEEEAADKNIRLMMRLDKEVYVNGDQSLLMRLVANLISNAIKYNKTDGFVAVDLTSQNNEAVLSVSDSGIGIPAAEQARIFDRFYRVNSSRERQNAGEYSSGLGLSIVMWAVEAHGGSIEVQSNEGSGSVFLVKLPLAKQD